MNTECCGSQLYHTGVCCHDEALQQELAMAIMNEYKSPEQPKKSCGCGNGGKKEGGSCGCGSKKKESFSYTNLTYAKSGGGCGSNCTCS